MDNNYFFVDGSALLSDIRRLQKRDARFVSAQFSLVKLVNHFASFYRQWHGGSYRRVVFYFVHDDERLRDLVDIPDSSQPGQVNDLRIEYCGKRVAQSEKAKAWLEENGAPQYVRDCLHRSEKAVDTQICCDALQLAAMGKLDRLFLYTNDYDFVPLCRAIRALGANINLFRLQADDVNKDLTPECDAFHALEDWSLLHCFSLDPNQQPAETPANTASGGEDSAHEATAPEGQPVQCR